MALSAANSTTEPRAFSIGPLKMQIKTITAASADVSGTITFDGLTSISHVVISTLQLTAAATFSGNVATLAFVDPAATVHGVAIGLGR
jgi:hypothetical protein